MSMREIVLTELEGAQATSVEEAFHMDEQAFHVFYEKTARPLYCYLSRISGNVTLAEDLAQESYYRFLRASLKSSDEAYQKNYLFRIATNLTHDHWRRAPRSGPLAALDSPAAEALVSRDRTAEQVQQGSDLRRALDRLKPREREILWLAYVEGSSHKEIAEVVGLRAGSIRLLLFRARGKLADLLRRPAQAAQDAPEASKRASV